LSRGASTASSGFDGRAAGVGGADWYDFALDGRIPGAIMAVAGLPPGGRFKLKRDRS
jgi:hypothetical protein